MGEERYKDIKIKYIDNHVLVAVKPFGMLSQGDVTGDADILSLLKEYVKQKYQKPYDAWLGLVQRLDRPTGGLMVFARTSKSASRLCEQMRNRKIKKIYYAKVRGCPEEDHGTIENIIAKELDKNRVNIYDSNEIEKGSAAKLYYETVEKAGDFSILKIDLMTGKPHQIRAQLSYLGFPIEGDIKYGGMKNNIKNGICLWAGELGFTHPTLKTELSFKEPYPF